MLNQSQVIRTESTPLPSPAAEVRDHLTTTHPLSQVETASTAAPTHPKGHKVRALDDVWKTMDSQSFLHLTDTTVLSDVWVQPKAVEPTTGVYANIEFLQIVAAPHIKYRTATSKMSLDDLLKMLYLNDVMQWAIQGPSRYSYEEWLADKTAAFIKKHGVADSNNKSSLCNFIISEDISFSFYPVFHCSPEMTNTTKSGIFFRKICYHSYKQADGGEADKIDNPSMMKCCASRGKFEYVFEARLFPLPDTWWQKDKVPVDVPESQDPLL